MNKTAIRNYAVWARREMIERVTQRAFEYGITADTAPDASVAVVNGRVLTSEEKRQRAELIRQIGQKGFERVMEEVAYTWFNRFIALRFMEVNNYLPSHVRVFTDETRAFRPALLRDALYAEIDGLDKSKVIALLDDNRTEELYRYLLLTQCNALSECLPQMFEHMGAYTELLFPNHILNEDSVLGRLIRDIPEEDFADGVEIIGWLYQFYISEKHEEVVDPLHSKIIPKEDIPAATQLFTTDWVVRYILDNTLGRYWIERHPESTLASKLTYLVTPKHGTIPTVEERVLPEDLKVLDPCVGSGHFLSYAFDVLLEIYRECGWSDRDAAASILEHNLYGLDIDDRAAQLGCFAVAMKARRYNRRILNGGVTVHVAAMQDTDGITEDLITYAANGDAALERDWRVLRIAFANAKEFGSMIEATPVDFDALYARLKEIESDVAQTLMDVAWQREAAERLLPVVRQAEILSQTYEVVVTNPPYMNKYSPAMKTYIQEHFADYKGDLFSVFMVRNFAFCKEGGYAGFMTPNVWMFIKTYEELRTYILREKSIVSLIQMAKGAFFKEATVDICAFVLKNAPAKEKGLYIRLEDIKGDMEVQRRGVLDALRADDCGYFYETDAERFTVVPGSPIAYWVKDAYVRIFQNGTSLSALADPRQGLATADNNTYLRLWHECDRSRVFLDCDSHERSAIDERRWYPYNKGGEFRKWYGNNEYVVNWYKDGRDLKADKKAVLRNPSYYFRPCITWSKISSGSIAFRFKPVGHLFDVAGTSVFAEPSMLAYLLAFCNSKVAMEIAKILSPTINYEVGHIANFPILVSEEHRSAIESMTAELIELSRADWDSCETSWDFVRHPLIGEIGGKRRLADIFAAWREVCDDRFDRVKELEEEINRLFIGIYGLQDTLTPDVEERDITIRRADVRRDIRSLISYAIGCLFGRYSLDTDGLVYAGGTWDAAAYTTVVPDADNIIPICDDDYFDDDLTGKFIAFVRTVYGEETLEENLRFIAEALGGKGTPARDVIRQYLIGGFYADHVKLYQKRPLYWLFDAGKKNGFKALMYMHRYAPDLPARMRTDYVHEQQERYRTQMDTLTEELEHAETFERIKLTKQQKKLQDQMLEIHVFEEKIHHLADRMIEWDTDDGVKRNYALFGDVLAKIR